VLPPLQARVDVAPVSLLLNEVVGFTGAELELDSVALTVVGTAVSTVLFEGLVIAVAGAHATSAKILIASTRLETFFRFISFLHF
jgi:hypothetical protein